MHVKPVRRNEFPAALSIIAALIIFMQPGRDMGNKPNASNPADSLIILPLVPYDPQPADGAVDARDDFTFSWQCYNPDSIPLEFHLYLGIDSITAAIGCDTSKSFTVPWSKQSRAKALLIQIYQMQMAYHSQYGPFCLNGMVASRTCPTSFSRIGVTIDSTDCYTYCMTSAANTFTCVATANIDNDPTWDTWQINETGALNQAMSDFTNGNPIEFRPAAEYSWRVLVLYNADRDSTWGPIWHFTTGE